MSASATPVVGRPAVFVHIQKTAGTSITEAVWPYYGGAIVSHGDWTNHSAESLRQFRFVSGHYGFATVQELIATRYSFVLLRDPIERVLSFYYYCRTQDPDEFSINALARQLDLAEFLRAGLEPGEIGMHIADQQAWQVAWGWTRPQLRPKSTFEDDELVALAKENLRKFSFVGLAETFDLDYKRILSDLGVPLPSTTPRANVTASRPHKDGISAEALKLVREVTKLDQAVYDEARAMRRY
jgi:hypothetical protein